MLAEVLTFFIVFEVGVYIDLWFIHLHSLKSFFTVSTLLTLYEVMIIMISKHRSEVSR